MYPLVFCKRLYFTISISKSAILIITLKAARNLIKYESGKYGNCINCIKDTHTSYYNIKPHFCFVTTAVIRVCETL